jgi:glycosyltransferase involved in cell wall biosynthesis
MKPLISIIVPLYNEEIVFSVLIERIENLIRSFSFPIEVVLIDDGSNDRTAVLMEELGKNKSGYHCIFLSRNFGHQIALSVGLKYANGHDGVMIIDGDLQDPPELLRDFYEMYKLGYDVVYAIRKSRKGNPLKKLMYASFYRLLKQIANIDIPLDCGDFSFISRRVVNILNDMPEESRFLRGIRSWVGFKQIGIEYHREGRLAGSSKYSLKKLFKLGLDGIYNFSEFPIKFISFIGISAIALSVIYFTVTLVKKIVYDLVPTGFTATVFLIIFFAGIQLVSINILGQYILRIFFQVKNRPLFIVKRRIYENVESSEED